MIDASQTLPLLVKQRAQVDPDKVFIHQVETDTSLTYGEAHRQALRWAHALQRLQVGREDTVISMLPVGFDAVNCWVGCTWLVAWEVPVNTAYQGKMLDYTIENSRARVGVISERYLDRLAALDGPVGHLEVVVVPDASAPLPN
ncbi:MAG: AMP-binding protein, partial [Acidimicrobiales bacterium]|nr:AMP-binding protein [Acidimicrobiales bacterium]